jgi:hypothetical protein
VEHVEHVNKDGLSDKTDLDAIDQNQLVIASKDSTMHHGPVCNVQLAKEDLLIKEVVNNLLLVLATFNTMVSGMLNTVEHAEHALKGMDT